MATAPEVNPAAAGCSFEWSACLSSFDTNNIHLPAADTAAVVTLAADADQRNIISQAHWSYSAAPTGGSLIITDGGTPVFKVYITAAGPGSVTFDPPLSGATNSAVVATLAAPGGAVVGTLCLNAYREK